MMMSVEKKIPMVRYLDPASSGLPEDWIVEEKQRNISTKTSTKYDRYYYEPVTGRRFRSLKTAFEHIEATKKVNVPKLKEPPNLKPTSSSTIETKRTVVPIASAPEEKDNIQSASSIIQKKGKGKATISSCKIEDKLLAYVCSNKLDASEILVEYNDCYGMRSDLNTLKPRKWIVDAVINLVACQLNTKEKEYKGYRMIQSYLPTTFALQVFGINININKVLEVYTSKYLSNLENTSKIFVPLNDIDHWFLCVIDLPQKEVYILDSLPSKTREKERVGMVKSILSVLCIRNLAKYNLQEFSISRPNWVPQQENGWDCGLYVVRFMQELDTIPPVNDSNLRVDYSNDFRRKLLLDLVLDDNNQVKQHILDLLNKNLK